MTGERQSLLISLPFTAGVAIWEFLLAEKIGGYRDVLTISLMLSGIVTFASSRLLTRQTALWGFMVLLCCGLMSAASREMLGTEQSSALTIISSSGETVKNAVRAIPFSNEMTQGLLLALVTGDKSSLDRHTASLFRQSGAAHLLALSGLHLGLIYAILSRILLCCGNSPLSKKIRSLLIVAFCLWFTLMAGCPSSLTRAFIFIALREFAKLSCRGLSVLRSVNDALVIQLALSPQAILSAGFQLSYLAVTGIAILYPELEKIYPDSGKKYDLMRKIWCAAALSISCQLFTAPISWIHFHSFPKYFLLTNILTTPLVSLFMFSGMAATIWAMASDCPQWLATVNEATGTFLVSTLENIILLP